MRRLSKLLICLVAVSGAVAGSEEATVPEAAAVDVTKAETKGWPAVLKPGPLLAKVVFADGRIVQKCWVELLSQGAWVVVDGGFCWYLRETLREVTILDEEPDEALKKSLESAVSRRKAEQARLREADEARERAKAEAAKEAPVAEVVHVVGKGAETGKGADKVAAANAAGANPLDAARGVPDLARVTDVSRPSGSSSVGGGGGPVRRYGVFDHDLNLLVQWRVKGLDRERGTVTLRNRGLKHIIALEVQDPEDLEHVKRHDILLGTLSPTEPQLTAKDGTIVEFQPITAEP